MGLETGITIAALNPAWPLGTDPRSQGDDHIRLLKSIMQADALSKALATLQTLAGPLRISNIYIGAQPDGSSATMHISPAAGSTLVLRGGTDTNAMIIVRNASNVQVARFDMDDTSASDVTTLITRRKGDARYVDKSATSGTQALSAGANLKVGSFYIGANAVGTSDGNRLSCTEAFAMQANVSAVGSAHFQFVNDAANTVAAIYGAGTAVGGTTTVITREKGDTRYAAKTLLRDALAALPAMPTGAQVVAALMHALDAPIDMSGDDPVPLDV